MTTITTFEEYKALTMAAVEEFNQHDYRDALQKFQKMAKANYQNPKIHEVLVYIYLKLNMIQEAEAELKIYREMLGKEVPQVSLVSTRTFHDLVEDAGDQKQLEKEYKSVMESKKEVDPYEGADTASRLGIIYMSQGNYKKAEEVLLAFKDKLLQTADSRLLEAVSA